MEPIIRKRIAIVYDWIDKWGGVERVLLTLHEMFPKAEFYASYYDCEKAPWSKDLKINTSFIQKLPHFIRGDRLASLPLYPYAFESFDFLGYDLIISVTSSFAKSIITKPATRHICYLLTPTRFLWSHSHEYLKNSILKSIASAYITKLREWDFIAAQRPDQIISISQTVANRTRKYYKRESKVIYPPFDVKYWEEIKKNVILERPKGAIESLKILSSRLRHDSRMTNKKQKYFLVVSRLEPYKKVELVFQSINKLKQNLVVVGEGSQLSRLRQMAKDRVTFLSKLGDQELGYLYSNAEALIMPQEEDFGYVSLEAQFFGCPVIAYNRGGATETVIENKTGILFEKQSVGSLGDAMKKFNMIKYELKRKTKEFGEKNVERFSRTQFKEKFQNNLLNFLNILSSRT